MCSTNWGQYLGYKIISNDMLYKILKYYISTI